VQRLKRSARVCGRAQAPEGAEEDVFFGREAGSGRLPKFVELLKFKARRGAALDRSGVAGPAFCGGPRRGCAPHQAFERKFEDLVSR
jgi:hypothetical protein